MNRQSEYTVVIEREFSTFLQAVKNLVEDGWFAIGGVSHTVDRMFMQALVKYAEYLPGMTQYKHHPASVPASEGDDTVTDTADTVDTAERPEPERQQDTPDTAKGGYSSSP